MKGLMLLHGRWGLSNIMEAGTKRCMVASDMTHSVIIPQGLVCLRQLLLSYLGNATQFDLCPSNMELTAPEALHLWLLSHL